MTSLGNDIVALSAINAERTKRESFYTKILAPAEIGHYQDLFHDKIDFEVYLWLLWAIKESSFKCLQRHQADLIFSPRNIITEQVDLKSDQLVCSVPLLNLHFTGFNEPVNCKTIVSFQGKVLYCRAILTTEWIYSVVTDDENGFEKIHWGIRQLSSSDYDHQHQSVREFVLERLNQKYSGSTRIIQSSTGYPVIQQGQVALDHLLSFTHHEKLTAYAYY